jgi:hypothetical protein
MKINTGIQGNWMGRTLIHPAADENLASFHNEWGYYTNSLRDLIKIRIMLENK